MAFGFLARGELTRQPTEMQNQLHDDQSVKARSYVVNYNSHAFRKLFQAAQRRRLYNVEPSKKYKAEQERFPRYRHGDQRDQLAGYFVDDNPLWVFRTAGPRDAGCSGNSDGDSQQGEQNCGPRLPVRADPARDQPPQNHSRCRSPSPRPRPQPPDAKKRGNQLSPARPARYFGLRDSSSSNASLVSRTGDEIT